jgi:hypothetical protein
MIEMRPVLDVNNLPRTYRDLLHEYVQSRGVIQGNNSFFSLYLSEYRNYLREASASEYIEDFGPELAKFMAWFEGTTSADEVLVLYWW